jgi:hypothetical protein
VSNSVSVLLRDGTKMDYNKFLDNWKGSYPTHTIEIPKNDAHLRKLSERMGVTGLYAGYAKLVQEIIQKLDN